MEDLRIRFLAIPLGLFFFFFISTACLAAQNRIINDVEIIPSVNGTEIHILFNLRMQYIAHTPPNRGDFLQIQLRPLNTYGLAIEDLTVTEAPTWEPSPGVPLLEINYDGQGQIAPSFLQQDLSQQQKEILLRSFTAHLDLRFRTPVTYSVEMAPDLNSITIILPDITMKAKAEGKPIFFKKREAPKEIPVTARYAVQLLSSQSQISKEKLATHYLLDQYILYSTTAEIEGKTWYRWRLGFFTTEPEAAAAMEELKSLYPESWVVQVSQSEREAHPYIGKKEKEIAPSVLPERKVRSIPPDRLDAMWSEAEQAMTAGDYHRAIQLYTRILLHPEPEQQRKALELLGLARERNGQQAHAMALYEEFLQRFPDDPGADRIRQRLAGILTARARPREQLRKARAVAKGKAWETEFFGSVAQLYSFQESFIEGERNEDLDSLLSDADLNMRLRSKDFDIQTSFAGSNENNFTEGVGDSARLSVLYVDALAKKIDLYARIGRQSENRGGILGRFDGIFTSYKITPTIKANAVYGHPVASTRDTEIDTHKQFYGINFDFGTYLGHWDFNTFFIQQMVDDILDRRAVGGEARYFDPTLTAFGLVDYDIAYKTLNTLLLVCNLTVYDNTLLRFNIDYRKSPLLFTSNALSGQVVETIDELHATLSEDRIRELAEDRTADSTSVTFGITQPLTPKWQVDADVTRTKLSATPASGGVPAIPGTNGEYFYNLQFIGNGLLKEGDVAIFGFRYDNLDTSNNLGVSFNGRYPFTRNFRINPRLNWYYRKRENGGTRYRWRPVLRLDYSLNRYMRFEAELGAELSRDENIAGIVQKTRTHFFNVGYRVIY